MDLVDQVAFMVALEKCHLGADRRRLLFADRLDLTQRRRAVDFRLTGAQQIQIRPVHYQDRYHSCLACYFFGHVNLFYTAVERF